MDTTKLIEYLPAILLLLSVMTIVIIVLTKYGDKKIDEEFKVSNILLFVTAFLFVTILIVHLFREQIWTADTLKILIGALIGAGSTKLSVIGDIAGRDINKNIQNINEAISKIEGSIINQKKQIIGNNYDNDFLINTIYEKGNNIAEPIARVVQYWHNRGWSLKHFSSDYQGMDGIFLVFAKTMTGSSPEIFYYHGSNTNTFNEPV
jgi:hypothetical protein